MVRTDDSRDWSCWPHRPHRPRPQSPSSWGGLYGIDESSTLLTGLGTLVRLGRNQAGWENSVFREWSRAFRGLAALVAGVLLVAGLIGVSSVASTTPAGAA